MSLIHNFKKKEKEYVRDKPTRLQLYVDRCVKNELPTKEGLVSIFLEGLLNKNFKKDVYTKHCRALKECTKEAIDLENNCEIYGDNDPSKDPTKSKSSSTETPSTKEGKTLDTAVMVSSRESI